jgi:rSAM/selenodomain-associated transferase 1
MLFPQARLIIFCRAPVAGQSKTRLIPALGEQGAAELHRRMSQHVIHMALQSNLAEVELQCYPDSRHPFFMQLLEQQCIELNKQQGNDLGERMAHALQNALAHHPFAMIIGTDAPAIDADYLCEACEQLAAGTEVVLGPAEDGGYVMIGLSRFEPALFSGIDWGSEKVYAQTLKRVAQSGMSLHEMDYRWDVDNPSDLVKIQQTAGFSCLLDKLD